MHIHVYVCVTILILGVATFLASGLFAFRDGNSIAAWFGAGSGLIVFGAVLGLVARYSGSEVLSYWDGLRLAAHYVSVGIGAISLAFSFFFVSVAIVLSVLFTLIGVVTNNRRLAQQRFLDYLKALSKHRMYQ